MVFREAETLLDWSELMTRLAVHIPRMSLDTGVLKRDIRLGPISSGGMDDLIIRESLTIEECRNLIPPRDCRWELYQSIPGK